MSRIDKLLLPGEHVLYQAISHWIRLVPSILSLFASLQLFALGNTALLFLGAVIFFGALWWLGHNLLAAFTSRVIVTNRRFFATSGSGMPIQHLWQYEDIESVEVEQTVAQRRLGYGAVVIRERGDGQITLTGIFRPKRLRAAILLHQGNDNGQLIPDLRNDV